MKGPLSDELRPLLLFLAVVVGTGLCWGGVLGVGVGVVLLAFVAAVEWANRND